MDPVGEHTARGGIVVDLVIHENVLERLEGIPTNHHARRQQEARYTHGAECFHLAVTVSIAKQRVLWQRIEGVRVLSALLHGEKRHCIRDQIRQAVDGIWGSQTRRASTCNERRGIEQITR